MPVRTHNMKSLKSDPLYGLDSRLSWIMTGFCSWVMFTGTLSNRVTGFIYYGIVETFQVTREEASWPVTLSSCCFSLAGPAMGYLCRKFSCRVVVITCSLITGTGVMTCFFAPNIMFINIFFGVVHGVTMSGLFVGTSVVVAQYFQKRQTTACTVVFTACGLNTLFIPPLTEYFCSHYGVRGTFLLLGALIANTIPGAIAIRSPPWALPKKFKKDSTSKEKGVAPMSHVVSDKVTKEPEASHLLNQPNGVTKNIAHRQMESSLNWAGSVESFSLPIVNTRETTPDQPTLLETLKNFTKVRFFVDAFTFAIIIFGLTTFILLSVDLAKDRGILPSEAVYLLNAFCVGDIIFRAVSGYVIDSGLLSLEASMSSGFLLQAAVFEALVWCSSLPTFLLCSALLGVSNGFRIGLQAPTLVRDFGVEALPIMMGGMTFVIGVVSLTRPTLIGYYRDFHGKYDGLLHIVACANVFFTTVWTIKLLLRRRNIMRQERLATVAKGNPSKARTDSIS